MDVVRQFEENLQCSGYSQDFNNPLPIYLFSNINNGIPSHSCFQFLKEKLQSTIT